MKNIYPAQKGCLSWELEPLEVEKVDEIGVLEQPILTGFLMSFASDRRVVVEKSTPDCCGFPRKVYILRGYNLESVGCLRDERCTETRENHQNKRLPLP